MKYEYRVVRERAECKKSYRRYATLAGATKRLELLTSKEPWKLMGDGEADDFMCCSGFECGCGGMTVKESYEQRYGIM